MLTKATIFFIKIYRSICSPLFPASCRYYPTCSQYAMEALSRHGFSKGLWMSVRRVLRCHPLHPGGDDPVR